MEWAEDQQLPQAVFNCYTEVWKFRFVFEITHEVEKMVIKV